MTESITEVLIQTNDDLVRDFLKKQHLYIFRRHEIARACGSPSVYLNHIANLQAMTLYFWAMQ